jgi:hypothetical protein
VAEVCRTCLNEMWGSKCWLGGQPEHVSVRGRQNMSMGEAGITCQ